MIYARKNKNWTGEIFRRYWDSPIMSDFYWLKHQCTEELQEPFSDQDSQHIVNEAIWSEKYHQNDVDKERWFNVMPNDNPYVFIARTLFTATYYHH